MPSDLLIAPLLLFEVGIARKFAILVMFLLLLVILIVLFARDWVLA
jgi:hypothetical protein